MSGISGIRLLDSDADSTGGTVRRPLSVLRERVGRADATIFDVGASTGATIERLLGVFEQPTIHAFEPQTAAFTALHQRFGGRDRIHLNNIALADRVGIASLHRSSHQETASLFAQSAASEWAKSLNVSPAGEVTVALDTVDHYCAQHGIGAVDLLKLDIQGAEPECLDGAQTMLAAGAIRVVQAEIILHGFYERRGSFGAIEARLLPHGFHLLTVFDVLITTEGELLQLDAVFVRD